MDFGKCQVRGIRPRKLGVMLSFSVWSRRKECFMTGLSPFPQSEGTAVWLVSLVQHPALPEQLLIEILRGSGFGKEIGPCPASTASGLWYHP